MQRATDTGLQVTGAEFGAFVCNQTAPHPGSFPFYTVSGSGPTRSSTFLAHTTLADPLKDRAIIRSRDIGRDSRFRGPLPGDGLPHDTRGIRSYLAVPVRVLSGEILGALVYGHEEPDAFDETSELLIGTIASQAAFAIENSRMREHLSHQITDFDRGEVQRKVDAKRLGQLAAIVESSDDAIISKDLNGIITSWNEAATRILGYTADEIVGQSILKLIPEELHSDEPFILSRIRAGQRIEHFDTVRRAKSGELLDVSLTISPIKDENGTIIGASKILRDISSRKRIESSLIQAEKIAATGRMAATIAHEINNPLEAVLNLALPPAPARRHLGRQDLPQRGGDRAHPRRAHRQADPRLLPRAHLCRLRSRSPSWPNTPSPSTARAATPTTSPSSGTSSSDAKLTIRRGEMMQVISNLIANAIYAMPEGGKLNDLRLRRRTLPRRASSSPSRTTASASPRRISTRSSTPSSPPVSPSAPASASSSPVSSSRGTAARSRSKAAPTPKSTEPRSRVFLPLQTAYEKAAEAAA